MLLKSRRLHGRLAPSHRSTTLFGLLLVTFIISRMLPADPVLAIVGDHAVG